MDYSSLLRTNDWQKNLQEFCGQAAFCIAAVLQHSSNLGDWKAWHIDHSLHNSATVSLALGTSTETQKFCLIKNEGQTGQSDKDQPLSPCGCPVTLGWHLSFGNLTFQDQTEPSFDCQLLSSSWFAVPCVRTLGRPLQQVSFHKFWEPWKTNAFKHLQMNTVLHMWWVRLSWHLHVTIRLATWLFLLWLFLLIFVILFRMVSGKHTNQRGHFETPCPPLPPLQKGQCPPQKCSPRNMKSLCHSCHWFQVTQKHKHGYYDVE